MHVAIDEVSTSGITNRHHSEGCDEEESDDAQRTVVEELHPKVADLHVGSLTGIHHDALLTLAEAEEQQSQTYKGVDAHRCEPGCRILWKSLGFLIGEIGNEQGKTRTYCQTTAVSHEHTDRGQDGDLVGVAGERRVQSAIRYINKGIEQRHGYIRDIGIEQRWRKSVPETENGKACEGNTYKYQIRAVFSQLRIMLVDESTYNGVPNHVCHISHCEHHGYIDGIEAIDVCVEKQQVHTCSLENQVLRQVTRTESDALEPGKLVKAFVLVSCCHN